MLQTLSLRDFVIVESLNLDVQSGFTVLTGETGAGKSILIDALQLILGARGDAGVVREGAERTQIVAEFSLSERSRTWLNANELDAGEDTLLIRRTVDVKGRSRAWVNGIAVTAAQLRELGETLVDVHGQHAHQSLLKSSYQLKLLDDFAENGDVLKSVREAFEIWTKARKALEEATANADALAEKTERLQWMIEDLESLSPKENEWESLTQEHSRLAHGVAIREGLAAALETLHDGEVNATELLASVHGKLMGLARYDERLSAIAETLSTGMDLVEEAAQDVMRYVDRNDLDEEHFEKVDRRVSAYYELSRKFRCEPETLFERLENARSELKNLTSSKDVKALERAEKKALETYHARAAELTQRREDAGKLLANAVTEEMQMLAMKGARMETALIPNQPSANGSEHCEFLIAGHAGVQTRSLQKVASGGELARISLAIAVITAKITPVPTLIFDEVDSGIGGATAEVVGRLLRQLGSDRQVLCVTHLPQVAACGHHHWRVEKTQRDGKTQSNLSVLSLDDRVEEVARMLAGISITDSTKSVAREMLAQPTE